MRCSHLNRALGIKEAILNNGFVYILINPAFPKLIKIGETERNSEIRASELSRQTGVPEDYIVIYDELVSERKMVEDIMHTMFASYRSKRNKEFFDIAPKEAIRALQELACKFPITSPQSQFAVNLTQHFLKKFSKYLDPTIKKICLVMLPDVTYLEVTRLRDFDSQVVVSEDEIPLSGIIESSAPNQQELAQNEKLLKSCDEYDWIMIGNIFPEDKCYQIASLWEKPGGKLSKIRGNA